MIKNHVTIFYPVVRDGGHGDAHNPPRMIFGRLFSGFIGVFPLFFVAGEIFP